MKQAKVITKLEPQQERVLNKLRSGNLLVAHGLGSGKTLSSIAAADALGLPTAIVTPASLVENYKKEIAKHTDKGLSVPYGIQSITTASKHNSQVPEGSFLIADESHFARNYGTLRNKWLRDQADRAKRIMLLTGTPTYNQPSDIAPLINTLSGSNVLPNNPTEFNKQFVRESVVKPGFIGRLLGVKPGKVQSLKNKQELLDVLRGKVDVYESTRNMPERIDKDVEVGMTQQQQKVYDFVAGKIPSILAWKIRMNLPPNKSESSSLNSFLSGVRQASNSPGGFVEGLTPLQAGEQSTKLTTARDSIMSKLKDNPRFKALIYSNYLASGVEPMAALLKKENIPHGVFYGGLNSAQKKELVDQYNAGKIRALIGSSSASEGLDLKGTRLIQLLEPHFNESKTNQVIGRGIRFGSHADLPPEERNVTVERYYSKPHVPWYRRVIDNDPGVDRYIRNRALEKQRLADELKQIMIKATGD